MMPLVLISTWDNGGKECCVSIAACFSSSLRRRSFKDQRSRSPNQQFLA